MSGIRYGVGNLDLWEQFGVAMGFGAGGLTILACMECGFQWEALPGDRAASLKIARDALEHIATCPPRKQPALVPSGPTFGAIVDRGVYKFYELGPDVNNDNEGDGA